jgi:cyclic pyranopterin phosphate synthase
MPEEGVKLLRHEDILSFDEIAEFTCVAVRHGITKVRITGGEPLVRKNIVALVGMIAGISGVSDLSMTTNGILLGEYAVALKQAGLQRVNISLDAIDPRRYNYITRIGNVKDVLEGIEVAINTGLLPVKINCVVRESRNEKDAMEVAEFCREKNLEIRYIRQMDLCKGFFSIVDGGTGGNCIICNRFRLTAQGKLKPCLFNPMEFDIREHGNEKALRLAAEYKPEAGVNNSTGNFYNIGG